MSTPDSKKVSEIVDIVKSWIPRRPEPANMSRDFWMPDQSCRVCYECDSQFNIFNRRHHCRLCGRVFCAKCSANSIPSSSNVLKSGQEDGDRIRVCNYCFKQWNQGSGDMMASSSPGLSLSPSSSSLISTQSSCTCNSGCSAGSVGYSIGPFQHVSCDIDPSPCQSEQMDSKPGRQNSATSPRRLDFVDADDSYNEKSDDEDDSYLSHMSHSGAICLSPSDKCYGTISCEETKNVYQLHEVHTNDENGDSTCNSTLFAENFESQRVDEATKLGEVAEQNDAQYVTPTVDVLSAVDNEPVDYENNGLLWLPPEPENDDDEKEALLSDDDDAHEDAGGEWGYLRSGSIGGGECRGRDRSNEEHRESMKRVVDGHFRALITQLLQAENLPVGKHDMEESWLDIITKLSWEAATFLKPDTSMGGGMDPGGYVKVKCIACGHRNESMVARGVVCKKNVAHRRMTSKISKARLLLLGGALEYQRVSNHLSSFDTLLQQEMDHLKMAVAKIDVHHPNVLLVEKSVSRYAQEYLLAKEISLVLNIKRPLLERIARCTGAQIVPSIDNLSAPKLGYCDFFHVEKFLEDLGSAGQGGKKLTKTLMFFEGCPRPLGCTVLLKGASGDDLKKVKNVIHYSVFAAYHLSLETSFLADEGASLPEFPLTSPIKVALPDKPSSFERSITMVHNNNLHQPGCQSKNNLFLDIRQSSRIVPMSETDPQGGAPSPNFPLPISNTDTVPPQEHISDADSYNETSGLGFREWYAGKMASNQIGETEGKDNIISNHILSPEVPKQRFGIPYAHENKVPPHLSSYESTYLGQDNNDNHGELPSSKEEFLPSPSDHQSILVSLSTRCVWKGSVCERAHLFRIKYYGCFDKPLGRYLWDNLFDQAYRCHSCEMPSEAHIYCYTHQQGSLTISVKKLSEFHLPGEREGKIWMWHRCLRCPRTNGFPPATKRVVMSDAAWGLSFGKFLELSFSNHAAASRVASCGHSLHRDCLRFYGFGRMVACFLYAPIDVHSVYLPPSKLEFNHQKQEWIQKELEEVNSKAHFLFTEVSEVLSQLTAKIAKSARMKAPESVKQIAELESMLQREKEDFEESLPFVFNEAKSGLPEIDILEINRLRRQLVMHSYVWDQRLIHVSRSCFLGWSNAVPQLTEKPGNTEEKPTGIDVFPRLGRGFNSCDSSLENFKPDRELAGKDHEQVSAAYEVNESVDTSLSESDIKKPDDHCQCSGASLVKKSDIPEIGITVRRARSVGQFPTVEALSDNLDAAWTGNLTPAAMVLEENEIGSPILLSSSSTPGIVSTSVEPTESNFASGKSMTQDTRPFYYVLPGTSPSDIDNPSSWIGIPFSTLYQSFNKNSTANTQKPCKISDYNPVYISSLRELVGWGGARLLLPLASSDTVVPVYDDEPTSIISYTLVSPDYKNLMSEEPERPWKDSFGSSSTLSILESINLFSTHSFDETPSESIRTLGSTDESILSSGSRSFSGLDPLLVPNALHARISFSDDGPPGKVKYNVTCYFAKQFEALRKACSASELDFIRSLSRCKKWGAQGGKSNVFFAKTLDDRFIIKQVTKTELESFLKFAPSYFKYLSESLNTGCPTCLAKILGIYQVTTKHMKGGKESKLDVLVMENLLFKRNITQLYDLKGSARSRYNSDSSGNNKVLLDQNLLEAMRTSPIFLGTKAKRLLERAVWNDTSFLASIDVMDYSLLVGVDDEKHELVLGIIDFMRQYTWDKHLETWVKASGILGGPKNASPTVISPKQYKKRFRKAMSAYFLMVPDQWSSSIVPHTGSQSDLSEENIQEKVPIKS
ncbi:Phosphatidylinositol-4-phosphate 5-kinase family protein isoform 1 [Dorcoceras hygrometricum]|uniref:1-phosphatidylinositol-3-phosphate 5-kinase n=1 Tax=Dorcoceras hygrometricum TaxID=472368 RepID=A0A2Z7AUK0_9LAMI|nr:Phosphatidylinositol-4-phosphate 5-kinase family protein isoform 1 [Dorcoceras hygrometricum]